MWQKSCRDKEVIIVSGGTVERDFLRQFTKKHEDAVIICVDGGLKPLFQENIKPDYIIGDFDTIEPEILEKYRGRESVSIMEYDPVKDATDTEIALEHGISLKPDVIYLLGATGTRFDHTLGNVQILKKALQAGVPAYIIDSHNVIYMTKDNMEIKKESLYGPYISLFPFTSQVTGVTLRGFKYPVTNHTFCIGGSLGISNEIIEDTGFLSLEDGILIIIEARD